MSFQSNQGQIKNAGAHEQPTYWPMHLTLGNVVDWFKVVLKVGSRIYDVPTGSNTAICRGWGAWDWRKLCFFGQTPGMVGREPTLKALRKGR